MRKMFLTVLCFFLIGSAAAWADTPWWQDRIIERIEYEDLVHVTPEDLSEITDRYIGQPLTSNLFQSLQNELYDLDYFSYFFAYARRPESGEPTVVITFNMVEHPLVTSLEITGNSVLRNQAIRDIIKVNQGEFFNRSLFRSDAVLIREAYLERGYADVTIDESFVVDEASNTVAITYEITEGAQSRIDTIAFAGNENYSANTLRREISSREQSLFNRGLFILSQIEQDKQAIVRFYQNRGYIDAQVREVKVEPVETDKDRIALGVTFVISEGPQWRFSGYDFDGNTLYSDETLKQNVRLQPGDPLNVSQLQKDFQSIADVYYDDGYIYNEIVPQEIRNEQDRTVKIEIFVVEKGQAFVEDILIVGNERTRDQVITREVTLQPGEVFSKQELITSIRNLYNTGLFDAVDAQPLFGTAEGLVDLEIDVVEANKIDLRFGATFGGAHDFPVSGFLSWNDKNFLGYGQDFSVGVEISPYRQNLKFSFIENWLFGRRWSGGLNLSFDRSEVSNVLQDRDGNQVPDPFDSMEEYLASRTAIEKEYLMSYLRYELGFGFSTGYTFHTDSGRISIGGGYNYTRTRVLYDDQQYRAWDSLIRQNMEEGWLFNNSVFFTTSLDRRDFVFQPTSGFLLHNRITLSGGYLNKLFFFDNPMSTNYVKNQSRFSAYHTLFDIPREEKENFYGVLSAETSFSFMFPQFSWSDDVQATRASKLFIDGMNTARGWEPEYYLEAIWDARLMLTMPLVRNILNAEVYTSGTWGIPDHRDLFTSFALEDVRFSTGAGVKLGIQGLPLGLYLVKNFTIDPQEGIKWVPGNIFKIPQWENSGLELVFTIDYSLF